MVTTERAHRPEAPLTGGTPIHLLIRADGGAAVGLGHITRCLAIASGLRELGVGSTFVTSSPAVVTRKLAAGGCGVVRVASLNWKADARFLLRQVEALGAGGVIVDSYTLGSSYQRTLRAAGVPVCVIADVPGGSFNADLVIDQRVGARASDHRAPKEARFLLGPRYSLLRPSFAAARRRGTRRRHRQRVLIVMGGSDPRGATLRVLTALDSLPSPFSIDVVAGAAIPRLAQLVSAAKNARHPTHLHRDPADLPAVMARASLAISAAGGTCWELACLGVPTLLLVTADNQEANAAGLARSGFALALGSATPFPGERLLESVSSLLESRQRLERMSCVGRRLVDGRGARRAAKALWSLIKRRRQRPARLRSR